MLYTFNIIITIYVCSKIEKLEKEIAEASTSLQERLRSDEQV